MARPKKDDKPGENSPVQPATISMDEFRKTRDSVIQGLTGLQLAVGNLLNAYMSHCNGILGEGNADSLDPGDLNRLAGAFAVGTATELLTAADIKKEKRKRAKKDRDPDMPKRPLTAAFLYGQNARSIIKQDLEAALPAGEKLGPNAVNEEVNRRWNSMAEEEKQLWKNAYQENMVKYKLQMTEYAARKGASIAEVHEMVEEEVGDAGTGAAVAVTDVSEDEHDSSPPPKAPTPPPVSKANKRRRIVKENGVTESPIPLPNTGKAAVAATPSKVEEKKSKKKKEAPAPQEKEASPEEPKKKRSRKSRGGEETAEVEPAPDAEKRKRKRKGD